MFLFRIHLITNGEKGESQMIEDFADKLKALRKKKKVTQKQVSTQLNISKSSISGYETNAKTPNIELLRSLACYYNISTDYLLGLSPDPQKTYIDVTDLTEKQKAIIDLLLQEFKTVPLKKRTPSG